MLQEPLDSYSQDGIENIKSYSREGSGYLGVVSGLIPTYTHLQLGLFKGKSRVHFKEYPRYIPTYTTYIWIM